MRKRQLFLFLTLIFTLSSAVMAQNSTTSLRGTITDSSGAAVPGATVKLANPAIGFQTESKSDGHGEYSFQQLAPGDYTITFNATGFGTYVVKTALQVAQPATANAKLTVSAQDVTVEVQADSGAVNTTDASMGGVINAEEIMQLPAAERDPASLLALQPGVLFLGSASSGMTNADSRNGSVSGARPDQTNITLDGIDNNDQIFPTAFAGALRVSLDAVEQFRVTTSNAGADSGRSSGGQINLVTRSGTDVLHGSIYDYNRSSIGSANDWFVKQGQLASDEPNRPGNIKYNVYGGRIAGPIMKDKIFLFAGYEGERSGLPEAVTQTVPTESLKAGILKYTDVNGDTISLSPAQVAAMDPNCSGLGTCPQGRGDNPASLALFKGYPVANGFLGGTDQLNNATYTFSSSTPAILNLYTARLDYNPSEKYRFYVRGSFQNDERSSTSFFPGQPPSSVSSVDSRGILGNFTWAPSSNKVNNLRYGFVRQSYANNGAGKGSYASFRNFSLPESSARSSATIVPLHNYSDDFSYTRGKHSFEVGANLRRYTYQNATTSSSFNSVTANASWLENAGVANTSDPANGVIVSFDPVAFGHTAVSDGFAANYDYAISALAGLEDEQTNNYNYFLAADGKTASSLAPGTPVARSFRSNEFESYIQDAWKPRSNLTLTLGIRWTVQQTPWETNGQQVQPTINLNDWFSNRAVNAAKGLTVQPEISFSPAGKFRGGKPFYPMHWGNVAPRFAVAYSPGFSDGIFADIFGGPGRSSIRASYGMYYDHFGEGLVANYSKRGSFSLSSSLSNSSGVLTPDTSPRFTGLHDLPNLIPSATANITYPQTPSADINGTGFAITNGLDDKIQAPYAESFNLSWQRDLKGGFSFETAYIGRVGRHILQSRDLAQPLDLVDPGSGMDYYQAATLLAQAADQGFKSVQAIPYWEHMFPNAKTATATATQTIYAREYKPQRGNETQPLVDLDIFCARQSACPATYRYWDDQYSSLYVTSSIGTSSYNAGQFILKHTGHGLSVNVAYTFSKAQDMGSDSEANAINTANQFGFILDAFNPRKNYAVSDFDTTHLFTANWVWSLPIGKGHHLGGSSGHLMNALIGGWDLSGIARKSSGLPFSVYEGGEWTTNWEFSSGMVQTGPIKMRHHIDADSGAPDAFDDPAAAEANLRLPYPGEAGQRNNFRGDGYFDIDAGLHKMIHVTEKISTTLAWETFNVTNSERFDAHNISQSVGFGPLGIYGGSYVPARSMQLSARIEF